MTYKLGKLPVKRDLRTIAFSNILNTAVLPPIPDIWDVDIGSGTNIPEGMFGNDKWGDCVIACRANQELRFQVYQQEKVINITTQDCLTEYWSEEAKNDSVSCWTKFLSNIGIAKHADNGLVMLDSLNEYRQKGWNLDGENYKIFAYTALNCKNHNELKQAIYLLDGIQIGVKLPASAQEQFSAGKPWTVVPGSPIEGGHCIYGVGYNDVGPIIVTWAQKVQTTWEWFDLYCDEMYGLISNKDVWQINNPINIELLQQYLNQITA